MSIEVEANESFVSQRRKRDPGDLYDIVGGSFDETGKEWVKTKVYFINFSKI
jgi:hypothetical protein